MFQTLSYQLYTATERQPSSDLASAEFAAGVRDLRLRLRRVFRPAPRVSGRHDRALRTRVATSGR